MQGAHNRDGILGRICQFLPSPHSIGWGRGGVCASQSPPRVLLYHVIVYAEHFLVLNRKSSDAEAECVCLRSSEDSRVRRSH